MMTNHVLLWALFGRSIPWLMVLIAVSVGCGQSKESRLPKEPGLPNAAQGQTGIEPVEQSDRVAAEPSAAETVAEPVTVDDSDSGDPPGEMTLPDIPLPPSADQGESQGVDQGTGAPSDAPPGQGGIELPSLDSQPQPSSSKVDPASRLQVASWQAIQQRAKSSGKVTVVDLWSVSCESCVRELPGLVQLQQSLKDELLCLAVNIDYDGRKTRPPESYTQVVGGVLDRMGADLPSFLCATPREDVLNELGLVSIPAVLIFDANGNLIKRFVHAGDTLDFTYESHVTPWIKAKALSVATSL